MKKYLATLVVGGVLVTAACSSSGDNSGPSTATSPPSTAGSITSSASLPTTSATQSYVLRGSGTGDPGVDVLINVAYRNGAVSPAATTVDVRAGQRIKVQVTSDKHQDIKVAGFPDETSDVDPGDPEGVDFTVSKAGETAVTLSPANVRLVTISAH